MCEDCLAAFRAFRARLTAGERSPAMIYFEEECRKRDLDPHSLTPQRDRLLRAVSAGLSSIALTISDDPLMLSLVAAQLAATARGMDTYSAKVFERLTHDLHEPSPPRPGDERS